jgi:cytoskeletal protein CcmA (bactofilin family)
MADTTAQTTIIGADARINGEMTFEGTARLLGTFEGRIASKGELQVAESASCKATVDVSRLSLEGTIEGDVNARERLEMTAKAKIKGNIVAARLVVADGATIIGHITIGGDGSAKAEDSTVESKPAARTAPYTSGNGRPEHRADFRSDHRAEVIARR